MVQAFNIRPNFIILALFVSAIVDAAPVDRRTLAPSNLITKGSSNTNTNANANVNAKANANVPQGQNANVLNVGSPVKASDPNGLDADVDLCSLAGVNGLVNSNCKSSTPSPISTATNTNGGVLDVGLLDDEKDESDDSNVASVDVLNTDGSVEDNNASASTTPLQTVKGSGSSNSNKGSGGKQGGKYNHGSNKHPSAHPKPAPAPSKGGQFINKGHGHQPVHPSAQPSKADTNTFIDCSTSGGVLGLGGLNVNSCNGGNGGNSLGGGSLNKNKGGLLPGVLRRAGPFGNSRFALPVDIKAERRGHPHPDQHPHAHPEQGKARNDAGIPTNVQYRRDGQVHPHPGPSHPKQHPHPAPSHPSPQNAHLAHRDVAKSHPHPHPEPVNDEKEMRRRNVDSHPHAHPQSHPQTNHHPSRSGENKQLSPALDGRAIAEHPSAHPHAHPQAHPQTSERRASEGHPHPEAHPHPQAGRRDVPSSAQGDVDGVSIEESKPNRREVNKMHPHPHPQAGRRDAVPQSSAQESAQSPVQGTEGDNATVSEGLEKRDLYKGEKDAESEALSEEYRRDVFVYHPDGFSGEERWKRAENPENLDDSNVMKDENAIETEAKDEQAEKMYA